MGIPVISSEDKKTQHTFCHRIYHVLSCHIIPYHTISYPMLCCQYYLKCQHRVRYSRVPQSDTAITTTYHPITQLDENKYTPLYRQVGCPLPLPPTPHIRTHIFIHTHSGMWYKCDSVIALLQNRVSSLYIMLSVTCNNFWSTKANIHPAAAINSINNRCMGLQVYLLR